MKQVRILALLCLLASPVLAQQVRVVTIAPATDVTLRLANKLRDPSIEAAVQRARRDPYPDGSTLLLLESVRKQEQSEWEQTFTWDMSQAFRNPTTYNVPFEYPPNPSNIPDGFGIANWLANAVLRTELPCKSIYTVDSIGEGKHGWWLTCDQGAHAYLIAFANKEWKLATKR